VLVHRAARDKDQRSNKDLRNRGMGPEFEQKQNWP
jgi:hypothetical protein